MINVFGTVKNTNEIILAPNFCNKKITSAKQNLD